MPWEGSVGPTYHFSENLGREPFDCCELSTGRCMNALSQKELKLDSRGGKYRENLDLERSVSSYKSLSYSNVDRDQFFAATNMYSIE